MRDRAADFRAALVDEDGRVWVRTPALFDVTDAVMHVVQARTAELEAENEMLRSRLARLEARE